MKFRLHAESLHVHRCPDHPRGCEYFTDHTLAWMIGNRDEARRQLVLFRVSVVSRITALSLVLTSIDRAIARLDLL